MSKITPWWFQAEAIAALFDYFKVKTGNPLVALPTGTGKSIIIAFFCKYAMQMWPKTRILCLTHIKELITQDYDEFILAWPEAPVGIYSAALKQRDTVMPIIFAGVASVKACIQDFGWRDLVVIDECFSPDTEILTEEGFVRFDMLGTQNVAQYALVSRNISFVKPLRYVRKPASDGLLQVETDKNFNVLVTPGHEMIVSGKKVRADKITCAGYCKIPVAGFAVGTDDTLLPWEKFAICFQADGSLHRANVNGSCICSFSFAKERKIKAFTAMLDETQFRYKHLDSRAAKGNVNQRERFMVYLDGLIDKTIVSYFNLTTMSLGKAKAIIEYMNLWDGHVATKNTYLYTTVNKVMADFYQAVATLAGYRSNLTVVKDDRSATFSDCYRLFINKATNEVQTQSWEATRVAYTGDVYCVEVPEGNIVTRRGGKVIVTGNCHLLGPSDKSMYQTIIRELKVINPALKVIGLTATPYRLGQGRITDDGLFTDICYDMTNMASFNRLVAEGFICPPITKKTGTEIDTSEISVVTGEFATGQLEAAVTKVMLAACQELCYRAADRISWIVFAPGIENSESIANVLNSFGVKTAAVHSKLKAHERDDRIQDFKDFKYRCLVSNNILTTGFNHKPVDCIGMMRPTLSPGLWVQMLGRGTRISPETQKHNVLVLDFAGNTRRLGPINDPVLPRKKGKGGGGDAPVRICEVCGTYCHASVRVCDCCGHEFDFSPKIASQASTDVILRTEASDLPIVENLPVKSILYSKHLKRGGHIPCLKVQYLTGYQSFTEYVHLEQPYGTAVAKQARDWWRERHSVEPPATVDEALTYQSALRAPKRINVIVNRKYPEVVSHEY